MYVQYQLHSSDFALDVRDSSLSIPVYPFTRYLIPSISTSTPFSQLMTLTHRETSLGGVSFIIPHRDKLICLVSTRLSRVSDEP